MTVGGNHMTIWTIAGNLAGICVCLLLASLIIALMIGITKLIFATAEDVKLDLEIKRFVKEQEAKTKSRMEEEKVKKSLANPPKTGSGQQRR